MHWRVARRSSRLRHGVFVGFFGLLIACSLTNAVSAVDSEIGATVCGSGSPGASIQITEPIDDSVVNQTPTTFRGSVNNASQLVIEIDGQYVSTIAIGSNQTTFATDISLNVGTHTIKIIANDICGGSDADDSIVITYQPAVEPSNGGTTPTVVDGQPVGVTGEEKVNASEDASSFTQQIQQLPIIGAAVSIVSDFVSAIGLESTVASGNAPAITGVARVGITVAALTSVVMASTLAPIAAQAVPGISEVFNASSHRSMIYLGWVIRGVGVLAMAFAYFL